MLMRLAVEEDGQDMIEYALLLAFVTLASAALFLAPHDSMEKITNRTTEILDRAQNSSL